MLSQSVEHKHVFLYDFMVKVSKYQIVASFIASRTYIELSKIQALLLLELTPNSPICELYNL